ncbi:aminodeoxychorismate synthase component I [Williamsia phyllosphaerae]|uniref:Aminodeoxychorismate synthase component I n=1 Tax=Williamsia phyllosphaerae TaxID=885042 RepID=A0ABQ1V0T4_9NOCA|nr:aminodeoxychorismate synthase component I [Williamsia phyllosphaerae]GGF33438.1 aminodeoxychorismate synthase component I [Williamsia phyllosphaerae]
MASRVTDLGPGRSPSALLAALHERSVVAGVPGPAGFIGDWLGGDAAIIPSVDVRAGVRPPDDPTRFWVGYLAYPDRLAEAALPAVVGGVSPDVLTHEGGRWFHHDATGSSCPDWLRACVSGDLNPPPTRAWSTRWTTPPRAPHDAAIRSCLEAIAAGEVYQACVCTRFTGHLTGRPVDFFVAGVESMRPRKAAYVSGDWGAVASFSPETYLHVHDRTVTSSPIKGTVPSGADPTSLLSSVKDVAENVMIVDLVRNDLGRLAVPGSVTVPELLAVHPAPGVWHLVSTVAATLPDDVGNDALIEATFPPGSVTGTPKIRARTLLQGWETSARGVYCGAVGIATPDGDLDLNVAIRTVEITPDGTTALGVGGGITIDSDPDREWQECLDKAASIISMTSSAS